MPFCSLAERLLFCLFGNFFEKVIAKKLIQKEFITRVQSPPFKIGAFLLKLEFFRSGNGKLD